MIGEPSPQPPGHADIDRLACDLERAAHQLRLAGLAAGTGERLDAPLAIAEHYRRARTRRPRLFREGQPADPAWDIMIDLFIAQRSGRDVSVSSACLAGLVPATTGLRWIERLCAAGLTRRETDPADRRRTLLRLSAAGETAVAEWIDCMSRGSVRGAPTR